MRREEENAGGRHSKNIDLKAQHRKRNISRNPKNGTKSESAIAQNGTKSESAIGKKREHKWEPKERYQK